MEPIVINGKAYPMWSQFVHMKGQWVGGVLEDCGDNMDRSFGFTSAATTITDIQLLPNGEDSAMFEVCGKDFTCGGDVEHLGVVVGEKGWMTFSGYGGHTFRIKGMEE